MDRRHPPFPLPRNWRASGACLSPGWRVPVASAARRC